MTSYRYAVPDDEPFIVSGWSASYRMSRDVAHVQMEMWAAGFWHPVVKAVLARPRVKTVVAYGELLRGFLCYELSEIGNVPSVHYAYVAEPYRGWGIVRGMFYAAGIDPERPFNYTCRTQGSWELLVKYRKAPLAHYDPYRGRYAEEKRHETAAANQGW